MSGPHACLQKILKISNFTCEIKLHGGTERWPVCWEHAAAAQRTYCMSELLVECVTRASATGDPAGLASRSALSMRDLVASTSISQLSDSSRFSDHVRMNSALHIQPSCTPVYVDKDCTLPNPMLVHVGVLRIDVSTWADCAALVLRLRADQHALAEH